MLNPMLEKEEDKRASKLDYFAQADPQRLVALL
jgi:hypothetical protein